ncbi:MAG: regulatory iron-sulfur-containing complex subunit RicT, partial [Terriglobia bacterium]
MPNVVGVVFKEAGKVYDFDRQELGIEVADQVIVETAQGLMLGQVVELSKRPDGESGKGLKRVLRKATEKDLDLAEKARKREKEALEVCDEKIKKHKLPMKLVDAECVFDGSRIVFYFSAESRVDFRDLVK